MRSGIRDREINNLLITLYVILPFLLWLITFVLFKEIFYILMTLSTGVLGILTIILFREYIKRRLDLKVLLAGTATALALYLVFLGGDFISTKLGLSSYIDYVYNLLNTAPDKMTFSLILIWIGVFEEIYWRGGLQGLITKMGYNRPWLISSILYASAHISTMNPILVVAALIVGLILGKLVDIYGVIASSIGHVLWLEAMIIIFPFR
jgi:hypothetical protein